MQYGTVGNRLGNLQIPVPSLKAGSPVNTRGAKVSDAFGVVSNVVVLERKKITIICGKTGNGREH